MGRIKPLWQLQREVEYAQKRETFLKRTDRPIKSTVDRRQKVIVGYRSSLIVIGTTHALIELQASQAALTRFGNEASLGLIERSNALMDEAIKEPKGFRPAMIHGLVGAATPSVATAAGSGRRYIKYGAASAGAAQASFSAPVSSGDVNPTPTEQAARAKTVADAQAASFNATDTGYGRLWFEAEQYSSPLV